MIRAADTIAPDFTVYSIGAMCASICTRLPLDEATRRLNAEHPTGVHPWFPSSDKAFACGAPNPSPCSRRPETHRHCLFNC